MNIGRHDGADKGGALFRLFTAPGRLILWIQYMSPAGDADQRGRVEQTRRRSSSPAMAVLYSIIVWAAAAVITYAVCTSNSTQESNSSGYRDN